MKPSKTAAGTLTTPLSDQNLAAELLGGLSVRTLERWRIEGRGPRFVRVGRRVMYRAEDLAAFVEAGLRVSTCGRGSRP